MLISHAHRFIFIKTIKTAGTSIEGFLEPYCCPPGHVVEHWTPTLVSSFGVVGRRWPQNDREDYGFYNHMPASEIRSLVPEFDAYTRITSVRDPYDRAVSQFHYIHEFLPPMGQIPLEDAIRLHKQKQHDILRALFLDFLNNFGYNEENILCINGELAVEHWIRYESMINDLEELVGNLALPLKGSVTEALPRFKQNRFGRNDTPPINAYLSPEAIELINSRSSLSFEHFGYQRRQATDLE